MADFVFPPGGDGVEVLAPNGVKYYWDVDNQRWGIRGNSQTISGVVKISNIEPDGVDGDLWYNTAQPGYHTLYIKKDGVWEQAAPGWQEYQDALETIPKTWFGDDPPTDPGYTYWWDTTLLELCVLYGGMWFPATAIQNDIPSLQEVLENSPAVTTKDIFLTNTESDIIDISPTEARIVIGTIGEGSAPKFELRHKEGVDDSLALFEIDDGGKRLDIEADGHIDNIHFQFSGQDKFILNKAGDAEFIGKVKVDPGTTGNEVVTYQQLQNISGEIDEIKEQKEKGNWTVENPSVGSDSDTVVLIEDLEAGSTGNNQIIIEEKGGDNGAGQVVMLLTGAETEPLRNVLNALDVEYLADPDAFKDKYSFFCPWAEGEGLAVREQPFYKVEATSASTFLIFFNGPQTSAKQGTGVGIKIFEDNGEIDLPESGDFYLESYADGWQPTLDFETATRLVFNKTDTAGVTHTFAEVEVGDSVRINDSETGHFLIAEITQIWGLNNANYIRFGIINLSHTGLARQSEACAVEFYKFNEVEVNLDDYVQKAGDVMTGALAIVPESGSGALTLAPGPAAVGTSANILSVASSNNNLVFFADEAGNVGVSASSGWTPTGDHHLTPKKYVDDNTVKAGSSGIRIDVAENGVYYITGGL